MAASVLIVVGEGGNEQLISEIAAATAKLQKGQAGGQIGPVIDDIAVKRCHNYIEDSEKNGAEILVDGRAWSGAAAGHWVGPTVIVHKNANDKALKDEIFGPILSIICLNTWEEALAMENANPYGNAASIYTERGANAEYFTRR